MTVMAAVGGVCLLILAALWVRRMVISWRQASELIAHVRAEAVRAREEMAERHNGSMP